MGVILKFEKREVSSWVSAIAPYASIPASFILMALMLYMTGYDPIRGFSGFFQGAFLNPMGIATSLANLAPPSLSWRSITSNFSGSFIEL